MLIDELKKNFNYNEPIFTEEILNLLSNDSRAQVFRYINQSKDKGEIIQFDKGVYYIPKKTIIGPSTITADMIIEKKYLSDKKNTYGVYSGIKLFNNFSMTTQMAAVIEVVTNNESAKCREIILKNRRFILRKSRCQIDNDNVAAYTILQLFSEFKKDDYLNEDAKRRLLEYISKTGVTKEQLFNLSMNFPPRTIQNIIGSGILNEVA